jgi:phosphonate degradation associated HDIG domain protein
MITVSTVDDIADLYAARGNLHYGEGVTQAEHAAQCAALAEAGGGSPALIVAALLHDIGHLALNPEEVTDFRHDDRHEIAGARALGPLFGEAVSRPVALHVSAKRYLCCVEPDYASALSRASQASLELQGGAFTPAEAQDFERLPHWREAVALRRYDDSGKRSDAARKTFADFLPIVRDLALSRG